MVADSREIERLDEIIKEVAPEVDSAGQQILYRMALSAVDGDAERFKSVLRNAETLSPYQGNWKETPPSAGINLEKGLQVMDDGGLTKGSYAVLLALTGNNLEEARRLDHVVQQGVGEYTPNIMEISRMAIAYIVGRKK